MSLDHSQQQFIQEYLDKQPHYAVLIGPGGYGKTYTIKHLVNEVGLDGVYFCAPTGKAASVMEQSLNIKEDYNKPKTIHRLLQYNPSIGWFFNENNKLKSRYVIVDEASMIDSELMFRLISSIEGKIIFLGDDRQLPPVGPGQPFKDIIKYGKNLWKLKINHRQQQGCAIAGACENVRRLSIFQCRANLKFIEANDMDSVRKVVLDEYKRINDEDKIILCPQKTTQIGVDEINLLIKKNINPTKPDSHFIDFGIGDPVMQTVNNYKLAVFNGFIGKYLGNKKVQFDFNGTVKYNDSLQQLKLAYAITIHKSQGSQWKHGIIIASKSHSYMWNNNLLYTALSRFRETCTIIGDWKTIERSVKKYKRLERNTYLSEALNKKILYDK